MAVLHGKRGLFSFSGVNEAQDALVANFTVDGTCDTFDTSVMDASAVAAATHWKDYVAGFKDWTASVECFLDSAGIGTLGTLLGSEQTLTLDTTDGLAYSGTAICTGVSVGSSTDGAATANMTFQGTAQLSSA